MQQQHQLVYARHGSNNNKKTNSRMDSLQIQNVMKNIKCFAGVYAADQLPLLYNKIKKKIEYKDQAFIVNTDPSWRSGKHWVAFFIGLIKQEKSDAKIIIRIEFFDSFGYHRHRNQSDKNYNLSFIDTDYFRLFKEKLTKEFKSTATKIIISSNRQRLQHGDSALCGYYCCLFIYFRCSMHAKFNEILKMYSTIKVNNNNHNKKNNNNIKFKENDVKTVQMFEIFLWKTRAKKLLPHTLANTGPNDYLYNYLYQPSLQQQQKGGTRKINKIYQNCVSMNLCLCRN